MSKQDYIMQGRNEGIAFCDKIAKEKGLTMADVAKRMNMSQSGLSMALNRNLTLDVLNRIADALEVEIPDLFERKKEEENTIICPKCGSKFKLIE